jgi:M6 family metalloprotease-like protein
VVGPYTLPNTLDYYGENDASKNDKNPQQMIIDACTQANANGVDFTQYDTDNDGMVDNIFVYYAGYNEAEGGPANTVWPHRWSLADYTTKFDGKTVYDYACTSELNSSSGANMCGIGTFSHEFGHVLGLPDYYHTTDATGSKSTLDYWHIMDAGAYNNGGRTPPTYTAFDRFYLGWFTPEQVSTASDLTLLPLYQGITLPTSTTQQAYLLSATTHNMNGTNPSPKEFFMVEYRKKTGWDAYLPGEGMLIWHVDYDATAWSDNSPNNYTGSNQTAASHMRMYLQPLSGSTTTPGAAFSTGSFTPTTWSGTSINRDITSISKTATNVTFKLMGGAPVPAISTTGTLNQFSTYVNSPSSPQSFTVIGTLLSDNVSVTLSDPTHFDIKLSTDANWAKSLTIPLVSSAVNASVQVRFNPSAEGNIAANIVLQSGSISKTVTATGVGVVAPNPNAPVIQVGKIENQLAFTATRLNVAKTKTINVKTTDLVGNLSITLTGTNAAMFTASVTSLTKELTNTLVGTSINVTYKPTAIGQHSATLTISGGGLNPAKVITLSGEGK